MPNDVSDGADDTTSLSVLRSQAISPAAWLTVCFSLAGIAGIIWQAYASASSIPVTPLGFIWVLSGMSFICLIAAGRELYVREGIRLAAQHLAARGDERPTHALLRQNGLAASTRPLTTAAPPSASKDDTSRPVVVATYELHEVVDASDPEMEPFEVGYLAFHNLGPEAAFNIRIDPIVVAERHVTIFGGPIKLLKRDDTAERQIRGSLLKAIRDAQQGSAVGTRLPLNVRYEDRGGKEWHTAHVVEVTCDGIDIGPLGDREIYWTKLL